MQDVLEKIKITVTRALSGMTEEELWQEVEEASLYSRITVDRLKEIMESRGIPIRTVQYE